jgi:hypothetical protein
MINDNIDHHDLGPNHFTTRSDPTRHTRRLLTQLQQLGFRVTLNPAT